MMALLPTSSHHPGHPRSLFLTCGSFGTLSFDVQGLGDLSSSDIEAEGLKKRQDHRRLRHKCSFSSSAQHGASRANPHRCKPCPGPNRKMPCIIAIRLDLALDCLRLEEMTSLTDYLSVHRIHRTCQTHLTVRSNPSNLSSLRNPSNRSALSIYLSIYLSTCHLSAYLAAQVPTFPPIYGPVHVSFHLASLSNLSHVSNLSRLCVQLSVCIPTYLSIYLRTNLSN